MDSPLLRRIGHWRLCLVLVPWLLTGCGGGGDSSNSTTTGRVQVALTDQAGTYSSVVLTISEIRVVPVGYENDQTGSAMPLVVSFSPARTVDVMSMGYQQQLLGDAYVPVGTYQQMRLVLAANPNNGSPVNYVTRPGDPTRLPLRTPSGQQSGLKVVGRFVVQAGVINALALDFDPSRAIVEAGNSGNINLKPTGIRIVQMTQVLAQYGAIAGNVSPQAAWPSAVVYAYRQGVTDPFAAGSVNPEDGSFRIMLPAGSYYLVVVTPGYASYNTLDHQSGSLYQVIIGTDWVIEPVVLN